MTPLEIKMVKPSHMAGHCEGGCKSGNVPKRGNRQVWIMGRDGGQWCSGCAKHWQELFDEAVLGPAQQLQEAA